MTPARLPDERIAELATAFRDLRWDWTAGAVGELADRLGWSVYMTTGGTVWLDDGLGPASASVDLRDDRAVMVTAGTSAYIDQEAPEQRTWLRDEFARVVSVCTESLGSPTRRAPGELPMVSWAGAETTVAVWRTRVRVNLFVATNDYLEKWDKES
ncbi:hypothetical protein DZF91_22235 [Actinomadura logoneensis]|uniref:Uncharacterized protein n=1 Tax=Actinomadura logoneensis TaxID=2293572 RepID=A0A372JHJ8_9ACTN|nr:DUF6301 family protein [Actinomadura logoneensis]RFU39477.1 hypothetical protein DZF91_22235 [Actinomadura logoneensis]